MEARRDSDGRRPDPHRRGANADADENAHGCAYVDAHGHFDSNRDGYPPAADVDAYGHRDADAVAFAYCDGRCTSFAVADEDHDADRLSDPDAYGGADPDDAGRFRDGES